MIYKFSHDCEYRDIKITQGWRIPDSVMSPIIACQYCGERLVPKEVEEEKVYWSQIYDPEKFGQRFGEQT